MSANFLTKKNVIIIAVAVVLLIAIALGTFFAIDYALVNTPYDSVDLPEHIGIPTYMGATLSKASIEKEYQNAKTSLLESFTVKTSKTQGVITAGQNVTVTVKAYAYDNDVRGAEISKVSLTGYEITDIGNHKDGDDLFFPELQNIIIGTSFNYSSDYINNMAPNLVFTYPSDYSVEEVKGKKVLHVIYLLNVTESEQPEWNDALFANNVSAVNEFLGVKVDLQTVKAFEDYMYSEIKINLLWNNITSLSVVRAWPEKKVKNYENEFDAYYNAVMKANSWDFSTLLSNLNTNESGYINQRTSYAQGIVKEEMVLYEIIQAEKIRISNAEYVEIITKYASESDMTLEEFEDQNGKDLCKRTAIWEKTKRILLENAIIVD